MQIKSTQNHPWRCFSIILSTFYVKLSIVHVTSKEMGLHITVTACRKHRDISSWNQRQYSVKKTPSKFFFSSAGWLKIFNTHLNKLRLKNEQKLICKPKYQILPQVLLWKNDPPKKTSFFFLAKTHIKISIVLEFRKSCLHFLAVII